MSSHKNDDNDDDFDNDGEKDEEEGDNCEDDYEQNNRDLFNIISMSSLTSGSQFSLMARLKKERWWKQSADDDDHDHHDDDDGDGDGYEDDGEGWL